MPTETATPVPVPPAQTYPVQPLPAPRTTAPMPTVPATDAELLMLFAEHRDHAAFRRLAERHAGLVAAVCRRVLWNEQDVEDACQATLMVLARRAGSIRRRVSVAGWLFRVAHRTAVRAARLRLRSGERPLPPELPSEPAGGDALERLQAREACEILAGELERLPEQYRVPLILLYIEGKSIRDAAEELDCTHAALKGRVARARRLLRQRLLRRGVALSVVLGVWLRGSETSAAVLLTDQSIRTAVHYGATGRLAPGGSPNSVSLAQGALTMPSVTVTKSTLAVGITLLLGLATLTAAGLGGSSRTTDTAGSEPAIQSAADGASDNAPADAAVAVSLAQAEAATDEAVATEETAAGVLVDALDTDGNTAPQAPTALDLKAMSPVEERIREALESPVAAELNFADNSLTEVLEFMADAHDIRILPETAALEDVGINLDETRSWLVLSGVRLDSALNIILGEHDLAYVIEDEVLKITTKEEAASRREMHVYVLTHLVAGGFDPEQVKTAVEELDPEAVVQVMNDHLAVMQPQAGHRKTRDLLEQLARAMAVKP
jgi:RNA polymerase sigma factor (sigma-70 family)